MSTVGFRCRLVSANTCSTLPTQQTAVVRKTHCHNQDKNACMTHHEEWFVQVGNAGVGWRAPDGKYCCSLELASRSFFSFIRITCSTQNTCFRETIQICNVFSCSLTWSYELASSSSSDPSSESSSLKSPSSAAAAAAAKPHTGLLLFLEVAVVVIRCGKYDPRHQKM